MNFSGLHCKYKNLKKDSSSLKLLSLPSGPLIMGFIEYIFQDTQEILFEDARSELEAQLDLMRESDEIDTQTTASSYLNEWIKNGFLRELDNYLTKTDSTEVALRFCSDLEDRNRGTSGSHFKVVQDAVQDLIVAISTNKSEKLNILKKKKSEIEKQISSIDSGQYLELSDAELKEQIHEIYHLASLLTGDFRRIEEDIRKIDHDIRVKIIEEGSTRGGIIQEVMEQEAFLSETDAGRAFNSFFSILCNPDKNTEFGSQLRTILNHPSSKCLNPKQFNFLWRLMRELNEEADRVRAMRRKTTENLRKYVESGAATDALAIDRVLSKVERTGLELIELGINLNELTPFSIPAGKAEMTFIQNIKPLEPSEQINTSGVKEQENLRSPNTEVLESLSSVSIHNLATNIKKIMMY